MEYKEAELTTSDGVKIRAYVLIQPDPPTNDSPKSEEDHEASDSDEWVNAGKDSEILEKTPQAVLEEKTSTNEVSLFSNIRVRCRQDC